MTADARTRTEARLFALLTLAFGAFAVIMDAHPTAVFFGAGALLLVYFGADLSAIEITNWIRIRFRPSEGDREDE